MMQPTLQHIEKDEDLEIGEAAECMYNRGQQPPLHTP